MEKKGKERKGKPAAHLRAYLDGLFSRKVLRQMWLCFLLKEEK
jgi:hypothetical protein